MFSIDGVASRKEVVDVESVDVGVDVDVDEIVVVGDAMHIPPEQVYPGGQFVFDNIPQGNIQVPPWHSCPCARNGQSSCEVQDCWTETENSIENVDIKMNKRFE